MKTILLFAVCLAAVTDVEAQSELVFREDWKETPAELPVTQNHVSNKDLELRLYGPARDEVKKSFHPNIPNDPFYIWSGECTANWALALRHRTRLVDLTGDATIKFRSRQTGFRELRIIVQLEGGTWLVSDQYVGVSPDWTEQEFQVQNIRWRNLDIKRVTETSWAQNPDLSRVEEIGFTDLMAGGGSPASSRLDWIEVYGRSVRR